MCVCTYAHMHIHTLGHHAQCISICKSGWKCLRVIDYAFLSLYSTYYPFIAGPSSRAKINCKARKFKTYLFHMKFFCPIEEGRFHKGPHCPGLEDPQVVKNTQCDLWITDILCAPGPCISLRYSYQKSGQAFQLMFSRPLRPLNAVILGSWP